MKSFATLLLLVTMSLPAWAQDVPLPPARPDPNAISAPVPAEKPAEVVPEAPAAETVPPLTVTTDDGKVIPLPRKRPDPTATEPETPEAEDKPQVTATPVDPDAHIEPVPEIEAAPPKIYQSACPAVLLGKVEAKALPPIAEKQCGTQSPLALTGVMANGRMVTVSGGVTTTCGMATALPGWVESIDSYLFAKENTRIESVMVGTSYMCRNVNNASEGNLSFHAFADAMDVIGFKLADGRTVTVEGGWTDALSNEGRLLRFAHDSACGHFTTTLGPEANALHRDHLHIDLGCHGKTCTARLCE